MTPKGPRLPAALQTALWMATPLTLLEESRRRYGSTILFDFAPMGPNLFVSSPEAIRTVFTAAPESMRVADANAILRPIVGKSSLLILDGAEHLRHRRLLLPPFHGERMQVFEASIRDRADACVRRWPVGPPFALGPSLRALTLDVILHVVMGGDGDDARAPAPDAGPSLASLVTRYVALGNSWLLFAPPLQRDLGPRSPWGKVLALRKATDAALYAEVARRRAAHPSSASQGDARPPRDVLSLLLAARDEDGAPMTDRELRDELITLIVAGHETTSTALEWAIDRILAHPEIHAHLLDDLGAGRTEYLDAVIKETLRLRPVLPHVARRLTEPMELDGITMPAGSYVAPCVYLAHRRPESWPDPERFDPARFLGKKIDPYAWLPFGGGARRCIGMAFALMEMRVILTSVLTEVALVRHGQRDARTARRGITLTPEGLRVIVRGLRKAA